MGALRKILVLVLVAAVLSLGATGCGDKNGTTSEEHPSSEHPTEETPSEETPSEEHPTQEHPSGEHPQ